MDQVVDLDEAQPRGQLTPGQVDTDGGECRFEEPVGKFASTWVLFSQQNRAFASLDASHWQSLPVGDLWTDNFSNLVSVLKWQPAE